MLFGDKILEYWDDIIEDLKKMIAIPSVCGKEDGIYPFGKSPAAAIDLAMELCDKYNLSSKNIDYYACHAEIGQGNENAAVLAHLDIVPVGEGWDTDPYTLTIKDGFAYGRGTADNKGAAIVALHCLRALNDAKIKGKRKLRVIMGSGEEIGMADMEHYFAKEPLPAMGFTPDSAYGICNCEKGILHFTVKGKNKSIIKSFSAGTVVNAVPYKAEAEVFCSQEEALLLKTKATDKFKFTEINGGVKILACGVASHASSPENGVNAASMLIDLLATVFNEKIGEVLSFINSKIGMSYNGCKMDIACKDEPSGSLTFNLGLVSVVGENAEFSIDIRYPATLSGDDIVNKIKNQVVSAGLEYTGSSIQQPLYLPANGDLVKLLSAAYRDVTNEECNIFSMGGGTYARQMGGKGVAFGPVFSGLETNAHNCNEKIDIEAFKLHAKICLEAMYRMFTA